MRVKTKYKRIGRIISNLEPKVVEEFASINKAKKESRRLQEANGGLGCGYVQVLPLTSYKQSKAFNGPLSK